MNSEKLESILIDTFYLWYEEQLKKYNTNLQTIERELINPTELKLKIIPYLRKEIDTFTVKNAIIEELELPF